MAAMLKEEVLCKERSQCLYEELEQLKDQLNRRICREPIQSPAIQELSRQIDLLIAQYYKKR